MKIKEIIKKYKIEIILLVIFIVMRLPSLGYDCFNTDVWKWKARTYNFGSGVFELNFENTIQKYHPGVTLMWLGTFSVKVYNFYYDVVYGIPPLDNDISTVFELHFVQKLFVVFAIGVSLVSVLYIFRMLFGLKYTLIFFVLLNIEPFFVGLTRVFHLEGLLSVFMFSSFVWFFWYLQDKRAKSRLILSAFFGSLAVLTKTSGVFILPFAGLMIFVEETLKTGRLKFPSQNDIRRYVKWLGLYCLFFGLLWPAMWVNPVLVLKTMYRGVSEIGIEGDHVQYFLGNLVEDPGFMFYFVVLLAKSSVYTLIGLIGAFFILDKRKVAGVREFAIFTLLFALLYMVMITIPTKKLDRYILPSLIALVSISAFFFEWMLEKILSIRTTLSKIFAVLVFIPGAILVTGIHPDYFSYYSPLVGGLDKGIYILEPKWMVGQREIQDYFLEVKSMHGYDDFEPNQTFDELINSPNLKSKLTVGFQEKYYTQIFPFIRDIGGWATIKDLTAQAKVTRYFVYPVWSDDSHLEDRFKLDKLGEIYIRGVPVYNAYERVVK